jgi:hypothetical protein
MLWLGLWRTARNKETTLVTKIEEGGYTQPSFRFLGFSAPRNCRKREDRVIDRYSVTFRDMSFDRHPKNLGEHEGATRETHSGTAVL